MWDLGVFCSPCKWIDLQTGQENLEIRLTWSGDIPLTLWTARDYYDRVGMITAKSGESSVRAVVPADTTRVLLVGIQNAAFEPQPVPHPIPFEVTATVSAAVP